MVLNTLEKQTILAALRNGLGLTHACRGLHKHPRDVSAFIQATPPFALECQQQAIAGYQQLLVGLNDAQNKKAWEKWRSGRAFIDTFISTVNLWESFCTPADFSFQKTVLAIKHCKTLPETATAMGFTEIEFQERIYQDSKLIQWLIQNNYQI